MVNLLRRNWRGYNGGQATKDDLLNVCEVLASALKGQPVVYKGRVPELRTQMQALLVHVAKRLGTDIACSACKGTGRQPLHSEATMTKCVPCLGRGTLL